jgi:RNA polymerase sigma factor (sigma-70 family)
MIDIDPLPNDQLSDAALVRLYPRLRRFAAVVAPAEVGPDDLVQEALERLLARDTSGIVNVEAYLRQTMLRLASNHRRRLGRWRHAVTATAGLAASTDANAEYPSDVSFLDQLKPTARAVLFLHEVEGVDFATIGRQLGLSEDAVKQSARRSRRQLRNHIELGDQT